MNSYTIFPPTEDNVLVSFGIMDGALEKHIVDITNVKEDGKGLAIDYQVRGETDLSDEAIDFIVKPIAEDIITKSIEAAMKKEAEKKAAENNDSN